MPSEIPPSLAPLINELTLRLVDAIEAATHERGLALIASLFARIGAGAGLGKRAARRAERERHRALAALTKVFLRNIEQATRERVAEELDRQRAARIEARRAARLAAPVRRRPRPRPLPPPPDPEQLKRDAEMARLRALLKPTSDDLPAMPPEAPPPPPVAQPPSPTTPGEVLHALEKEIQDTVPSLAGLGPKRAGARIAAWAGQVRALRDGLSPELSALMRPATRIFLEHLTELRTALDADFVDALEPKWHPVDWQVYIEANRARAEGRPAALTAEQLVAHHRSMLKALVQPHRRHVPDQAGPVIAAAAEVLPPTDGQLRSAIRRHHAVDRRPERERRPRSDERNAEPGAFAGTSPAPEPALEETVDDSDTPAAEPAPVPAGPPAEPAPSAPDDGARPASPAGEGEFDQAWTK